MIVAAAIIREGHQVTEDELKEHCRQHLARYQVPKRIYLVGIYTDQAGWLLVDVEHYEQGFFTGGPVLLTKTPIISPFQGSRHGFWYPEAAAYSITPWGGINDFSRTLWLGRQPPSELPDDTTEAKSFRLSEILK